MDQQGAHLIFTDGSSLGNPGPGGWGAVLVLSGGRVIEMGGGAKTTTNNRMELVALIEGLRRIKGESGDLTIYIDSSYVHKGATVWSRTWTKNKWRTKTKKDVENRDLWEMLLPLLHDREKFGHVAWEHIPGHAGITGNERADEIATGFAAGSAVELFEGDLGDYAVDILNITVDDKKRDAHVRRKSNSRAKAYSYLSLVDGKVVRHGTWAECEKRVKGKPNVRFKKALSPSDESVILRGWGVLR